MTCLHLKMLANTSLLHVLDVRCTARRSGWSEEEAGNRPRLVLPRRGVFQWQARGEMHLVETGCLLLFEPDEPYRFGHPTHGGDDCTLIAFAPELWGEAVGARALRCCTRLSPARQYQSAVFYHAATRYARDALLLEELGLLLAYSLIDVLAAEPPRIQPSRGRRAAANHCRLVEATRACLAANYGAPGGLAAIARAVRSSPYHLARIFREHTGITLHRYRGHLRLAAALTALGEGCADLAGLALQLGYASHGHFSDAFRAAFGCSPSATRDLLTRAALAEMRKILEAQDALRK